MRGWIAIFVACSLGALSAARGAPAAPASRPTSRPAPTTQPTLRTFASARAALRFLLRRGPLASRGEGPARALVIGFGEYHQKKASLRVPSSLKRFTRQLLPLLGRRTSDLVIETWITEGNCGEEEKQVVEDVDQTTQRPQQTENEILTLVKRARRYKIRPHILTMSCADYRRLLSSDGGVDYERFLKMTAHQLRDKILGIAKVRLDPVKRAVDDAMRSVWTTQRRGATRSLVLVYGGALHNERAPTDKIAPYSYAQAVTRETDGRYVEIDLFVPEYIASDTTLLRDQAWFRLFIRHQSHRRALLIQRGPSSYVIVFRRQRAAARPSP
jgi:hypothetical protein